MFNIKAIVDELNSPPCHNSTGTLLALLRRSATTLLVWRDDGWKSGEFWGKTWYSNPQKR
jgi:hypothetical protein